MISAPSQVSLGFREAIRQAVQANPDLRRAGIDVRQAQQSVRQARGAFDTNLRAAVNYSGYKTLPVPGQFFSTLRTDIFGFEVGVDQRLPTGGTVGLSLGTTLSRSEMLISFSNPPEERTVPLWDTSLKLTVSHPLLKGIGLDVGLAPLRQARLRRDASRWALVGRARAVLRDILKGYLDVYEAQEATGVSLAALTQARRELRRAELFLTSGRLPESELVAYQLLVAQRERELVETRTRWLTRSLDLLQLTGSPRAGQRVLIQAQLSGLPLRRIIPSLSVAKQLALASSTELVGAQKQLQVAVISRKVARRNRLPSLDVNASFGPLGQSDSIGKSYENMVRFRGLSWSVGLTFAYLVGNRAARAAAQTASLGVSRELVTIEELRRTLATTAARTVALLEQARELVRVVRSEVQLAELRVKNERQRRESGRSTLFVIHEMENTLVSARYKLLSARIAFLKGCADLAALTGTLLSDLGVEARSARLSMRGR
ncbi:MAG: TolC family protein [bacterium]